MQGSGLEQMLETVYGKNTVVHIMSGKAVSRALRGHFLVDGALRRKLLSYIIGDELTETDEHKKTVSEVSELEANVVDPMQKEDFDKLSVLYQQVQDEAVALEDVSISQELQKLNEEVEKKMNHFKKNSRTAKLWLLYMHYVDIVKMFIRAERTGNWFEHLAATEKMLNLYAATGHMNYAKCARLYLQEMLDLKDNYPWLFDQFANKGYHCVRRTDKYWSGLWTDLTIEQTMMRSIKNRGGLTRGRGMSASVKHLWVSTLHQCAAVHQSMVSVTKTIHQTSEQHVELGVSRKKRDF